MMPMDLPEGYYIMIDYDPGQLRFHINLMIVEAIEMT